MLKGQMKLENELTKKATNVYICDTGLTGNKEYNGAYYIGGCDPMLETRIAEYL
jgi:nicotinamide riboside kinase